MSFSSAAVSRVVVALALALPRTAISSQPSPEPAVELVFVPAPGAPVFGVGSSASGAGNRDFAVFTGVGATRSERGRVALASPRAPEGAGDVPLPRPPAPSAIRSLTLAIGLTGRATTAGPSRLGRWRLEALVADESRENAGASASWLSAGKRNLALRLRGAFSSRLRASFGVSRTRPPLAARAAEWTGDSLPSAEMTESLEASYDLIQNHSLSARRAASLTVSARRSQFAAPASDPTTGFPDTDAIFADAAEHAPTTGFAFAGWRLPGPDQAVQNRVAEEIAASNLKLSLFPWLVDAAERDDWRASIESGFARVRPWHAGRAGTLENVHTIGGSWSAGSNRLAYRHETSVERAGGRTLDEISAGARPLASVAIQVAASRSQRPADDDEPALESVDVSATTTWTPTSDWALWSRLSSGDGRCGPRCESTFRGLDLQLSRQATLEVDGRRLPVQIHGGGSAQQLASTTSSDETADLRWSVSAGVSVTF